MPIGLYQYPSHSEGRRNAVMNQVCKDTRIKRIEPEEQNTASNIRRPSQIAFLPVRVASSPGNGVARYCTVPSVTVTGTIILHVRAVH